MGFETRLGWSGVQECDSSSTEADVTNRYLYICHGAFTFFPGPHDSHAMSVDGMPGLAGVVNDGDKNLSMITCEGDGLSLVKTSASIPTDDSEDDTNFKSLQGVGCSGRFRIISSGPCPSRPHQHCMSAAPVHSTPCDCCPAIAATTAWGMGVSALSLLHPGANSSTIANHGACDDYTVSRMRLHADAATLHVTVRRRAAGSHWRLPCHRVIQAFLKAHISVVNMQIQTRGRRCLSDARTSWSPDLRPRSAPHPTRLTGATRQSLTWRLAS